MLKRLVVTLAIPVFLLTAIFIPVYAQSNQGRIEGHITNLTTGGPPTEPLPSVEVLVNGWMVLRSGRDGEWNVTGLKPGEYTIQLNLPPGYSPAQEVLTASLWGDTTEIVDLAYYEGEAPVTNTLAALPTPVSTVPVTTAERVAVLGATATPTTSPPVISPTETTVISPALASAAALTTTTLPGRAGGGMASPRLFWFIWIGTGVMIIAAVAWLLRKGKAL